ncbi:MAG TPA: GNAT family N-acetyltransferase [Puia sp.]|nr:GNAT family N-acetyltransferase [Puia sp.]
MSQPVDIRLMLPEDLDILYKISRDAYSLNFGHHWEEGGLAAYMDKVFSRELLAAELAAPAIHYYVAFVDREPVAFMKLNLHSNLPGADPEKGIELDKLYILPDYKGFGIGGQFLELAFRVAGATGKETFWLAVIDTNTAAMAFYEKAGFRRHSQMRVGYPKFRKELKGMWRMEKKLSGNP